MTNTYNTGNPLGSTDARDLYDNASNMDEGMNSGTPSFTDRLGVIRKTWNGMETEFDLAQAGRETEFQDFLASSAYVSLGNYAAAISVTAYNQYVAFDGQFWRPIPGSVPFTTSGTWAGIGGDNEKFVLLGDNVLRQDLASDTDATKGAGQVGYDQSLAYSAGTVGDILKTGAVGFTRSSLSDAISTVGGMLSASWVNVWEYAALITVKPDPMDPLTWDWQPAIQAAVDSGAGVCYFPGPFVYNTESTVIVDAQIRLIADQAKRLGSPTGTRIYNTGVGDCVIYSNTAAISDCGIENLGLSALDGHALNIKYGAVRCYFKQLYLYTQHTGRSCIAGIYNTGTAGVDYIGTYSSVFEGGEYIVNNVPRVAPIIDFLANSTLVNGNCFRNLWVTHSNGRPAIRLMATVPGVLLTNNLFEGIITEVCSGGAILLQATQGTRIKGLRAWDTPAGYNSSVIQVSSDNTVAQNKGLIIEDYARMSDPLNGASEDIDLGFSLDTTIINHNSNVVGKINFRSRSAVVIGAVNATVTSDGAVTYVTGVALTTIAATIKGALAHTGTTAGFFGKTPVVQPAATADTSGATLVQLEAVVNGLKQKLRDLGLMAT